MDTGFIIGLTVGVAILLLCLVGFCCRYARKTKKTKVHVDKETLLILDTGSKQAKERWIQLSTKSRPQRQKTVSFRDVVNAADSAKFLRGSLQSRDYYGQPRDFSGKQKGDHASNSRSKWHSLKSCMKTSKIRSVNNKQRRHSDPWYGKNNRQCNSQGNSKPIPLRRIERPQSVKDIVEAIKQRNQMAEQPPFHDSYQSTHHIYDNNNDVTDFNQHYIGNDSTRTHSPDVLHSPPSPVNSSEEEYTPLRPELNNTYTEHVTTLDNHGHFTLLNDQVTDTQVSAAHAQFIVPKVSKTQTYNAQHNMMTPNVTSSSLKSDYMYATRTSDTGLNQFASREQSSNTIMTSEICENQTTTDQKMPCSFSTPSKMKSVAEQLRDLKRRRSLERNSEKIDPLGNSVCSSSQSPNTGCNTQGSPIITGSPPYNLDILRHCKSVDTSISTLANTGHDNEQTNGKNEHSASATNFPSTLEMYEPELSKSKLYSLRSVHPPRRPTKHRSKSCKGITTAHTPTPTSHSNGTTCHHTPSQTLYQPLVAEHSYVTSSTVLVTQSNRNASIMTSSRPKSVSRGLPFSPGTSMQTKHSLPSPASQSTHKSPPSASNPLQRQPPKPLSSGPAYPPPPPPMASGPPQPRLPPSPLVSGPPHPPPPPPLASGPPKPTPPPPMASGPPHTPPPPPMVSGPPNHPSPPSLASGPPRPPPPPSLASGPPYPPPPPPLASVPPKPPPPPPMASGSPHPPPPPPIASGQPHPPPPMTSGPPNPPPPPSLASGPSNAPPPPSLASGPPHPSPPPSLASGPSHPPPPPSLASGPPNLPPPPSLASGPPHPPPPPSLASGPPHPPPPPPLAPGPPNPPPPPPLLLGSPLAAPRKHIASRSLYPLQPFSSTPGPPHPPPPPPLASGPPYAPPPPSMHSGLPHTPHPPSLASEQAHAPPATSSGCPLAPSNGVKRMSFSGSSTVYSPKPYRSGTSIRRHVASPESKIHATNAVSNESVIRMPTGNEIVDNTERVISENNFAPVGTSTPGPSKTEVETVDTDEEEPSHSNRSVVHAYLERRRLQLANSTLDASQLSMDDSYLDETWSPIRKSFSEDKSIIEQDTDVYKSLTSKSSVTLDEYEHALHGDLSKKLAESRTIRNDPDIQALLADIRSRRQSYSDMH